MQAATTAKKPESLITLPTHIIAYVEPKVLNSTVQQLRKEENIRLIAPTSGKNNLFVLYNSNEPSKVYPFVSKLRAMQGVRRTSTLIPFEGYMAEKKPLGDEAFAFVFLNVREHRRVFEHLKQARIHSAYVVPGEYDIIATLSGKDHNDVFEKVAKLAEIPGVETTETVFAYKPIWG